MKIKHCYSRVRVGLESRVEPTMSWRTSMDEICAFMATTFTRQSGGQLRNVLDRYAVAVKKDGNTIGHLYTKNCFSNLLVVSRVVPRCCCCSVVLGVIRAISHQEGLSCKYGPRFVACIAFSTFLFASAMACEGPEADSEALWSSRQREGFMYRSRAMSSQASLTHELLIIIIHRSN